MNNQGSKVLQVQSKDQWDELVRKAQEQNSLIVAHFTTSWCIPFISMNSLFEELAEMYSDVQFLAVDMDDVMDLASQMQVKAMPTFIMIKDGVTFDRILGANEPEIRRRVDIFYQTYGANKV